MVFGLTRTSRLGLLTSRQILGAWPWPAARALVGLLFVGMLTVGCSDDSQVEETSRVDAGQEGEDDVSETSEKPPAAYEEYPPLFERLADGVGSPESDVREHSAFHPSPSLHPQMPPSEAWLNGDQKAIFRYGYAGHGDIIEGRFRIYLLVNFEPVPFGLIEATREEDSALPTDEEMLELEERSMVHHYEREEGEKYGMKVVVDSDAFEPGKANELRLLFVQADVEHPEEHRFDSARLDTELKGCVVYYDGEEPVEFEQLDEATRYTPSPLRRQYLMSAPGTFAESVEDAPEHLDEWQSIEEDGHPPDLRQLIDVNRETTTMRTSAIGQVGEAETTYFVVQYDHLTGEFEPLGLLQDLPYIEPWFDHDFSEDLATRFDTEVKLNEGEEAALVTFLFEGWFEHGDSPTLWDLEGYKLSNTLWLRRVEE